MSDETGYDITKIEERMKSLADIGFEGDTESNHAEADSLLLTIVRSHAPRVAELYDKVSKWYA